MILIGSRALALRAPVVLRRQPLDFDFIAKREELAPWAAEKEAVTETIAGTKKVKAMVGSSICEFEFAEDRPSSALLLDLVENDPETKHTPLGLVPSLDLLFAIKSSHKYLKNSPHFWKTLFDYHRMKDAGAKVREEHVGFLKMREKETYTYAHPKLNQKKDTFFADDNIKYVYDHDTIHQAVAIHGRPAYTFFQKDEAEVASDKNKFFDCDVAIKIASVLEESAVLAIERSLVPHPGVLTVKEAWKLAFSKVLTSITSGWWRAWAYENAYDVLKNYQPDFYEKFLAGVESGLVKRMA